MRRGGAFALVLLAFGLAGVAAGCGGSEEATPTPETVAEGTVAETETDGETQTDGGETETETEGGETETEGETEGEGDPEAGKQVFASAGCGSCHVLADANASGTIGPNLDESQPSHELVVDRVTNGMGAMPSFEGQLSEDEIQNVAAYVVQATSG